MRWPGLAPESVTVRSKGLEKPELVLLMLWTIAIILLILWLLGLVSSFTIHGLIHVLLVAAIIVIIVRLVSGGRMI